MIVVIDTKEIVRKMREAKEENVKHIREQNPTAPKDIIEQSVKNIRYHFDAGIKQFQSCKTDEDTLTLLQTMAINFTVLQLDMQSVESILRENGIDLQELANLIPTNSNKQPA